MTNNFSFSLRLPHNAVITNQKSKHLGSQDINCTNFVNIHPVPAQSEINGDESTKRQISLPAQPELSKKRRVSQPKSTASTLAPKSHHPWNQSDESSESDDSTDSNDSDDGAAEISVKDSRNSSKNAQGRDSGIYFRQNKGLELLQEGKAKAYLKIWKGFEGKKQLVLSSLNRDLFEIKQDGLIIGSSIVSPKCYFSFKKDCLLFDARVTQVMQSRLKGLEIRGYRMFPMFSFRRLKLSFGGGTCILIAKCQVDSPYVAFANIRSESAPNGKVPITEESDYIAIRIFYSKREHLVKVIGDVCGSARKFNIPVESARWV